MHARTVAVSLLSILLPLNAAGQSQSSPTAPGTVISLPNPDLPATYLERYEIPELAGAMPATGSMLVDGRLPRPIIDYVANANGIFQSVSIFENGLLVVRIDSGGARIRKRLLLPADALASYHQRVSPVTIAGTELSAMSDAATYELLRAYDAKGEPVERRFDPAVVLPTSLELARSMMQDIIRAVGHDREVTNPMAGYEPAVGDRLIREDQRLFEVVRVIEDTFVELKGLSEPTRMYIGIPDLQQLFVGIHRMVPR